MLFNSNMLDKLIEIFGSRTKALEILYLFKDLKPVVRHGFYDNELAKVVECCNKNKLAVETGVRNEVTESFISGLKKLFEEHYIDVPEEKEDVFESLVQEVAELETKLDEQTQKHMDTAKELNT